MLLDNGLCHKQSGAPDSTALTPEKDGLHAACTDHVCVSEHHYHSSQVWSRETMLKNGSPESWEEKWTF